MEAVDLGGGLRIWYGEVREGIKYYNQTATFTTLQWASYITYDLVCCFNLLRRQVKGWEAMDHGHQGEWKGFTWVLA